jgi:AcrR family transcriptional regulator
MFSVRGYEVTTNREIATEVGITPGALYHYFESKLDLYLAVNDDVVSQMLHRLSDSIAGLKSFADRMAAILDASLAMNLLDPSVARFVGTIRVDARRHPELALALRLRDDRLVRFFTNLVADGIDSGEIADEDRPLIQAFLLTILIGLTDAVSDDPNLQRLANEAIKRSLQGRLLDR